MKNNDEVILLIYQDIFAGIILCFIGAMMIISSLSFRQLTSAPIGPRFFPQLIGVSLIGINIYFISGKIRTLNSLVRQKVNYTTIGTNINLGTSKITNIYDLLLTIALLIGFALSLEYFGYIASSCVYLFLQILILSPDDKKNYKLFTVVAIVATFSIYFLFVNMFNLILPRGKLW